MGIFHRGRTPLQRALPSALSGGFKAKLVDGFRRLATVVEFLKLVALG